MNYVINSLDSVEHTRSSLKRLTFDSGKAELDEYIKKYAWTNHQDKRVARVFVASPIENLREMNGLCCVYSSQRWRRKKVLSKTWFYRISGSATIIIFAD